MKKINKEIFNKIQQINFFLFLLIFYFNIFLVFILNNINLNNIYFVLGNTLIMIFFFFINYVYKKEFIKKQDEIEKLLKQNLDKDNFDIYKIFKRNYVKKNILENEYKNLKLNFKKFIPEKFLKSLSRGIEEEIDIGLSEEKDLHIMFIDISGFTHISEDLTPEKSLFLLNIYFDGIVEISKANGGYVDKFLGDGIMLVFDSKNSDNVIKAAIEIRNLVNKINIAKFKHKITVGIGINSGKVILGTIGSKNRMDLTIIGDSVNIASRIESLTRKEKEWIIFSKSTYDLIENKNNFNIVKIGEKILRGKSEKIFLYGIEEKN